MHALRRSRAALHRHRRAAPGADRETDLSRTLVALLPGLGDALCAAPVLRFAFERGPADALTMLGAVREYAEQLGAFERVIHLPLLERPLAGLELLRARGEYDLVIVPFPATRWHYTAVGLAAGRRLAIHDYGGAVSALTRLAGGTLVPLRGGHRASENARLARALGWSGDDLSYLMPESWRARERRDVVGVHTGSMRYKGNEARRWPLEKFAGVVRVLRAQGVAVRCFFGPHEEEDAGRLASIDGVEIVQRPLSEAARAIAECGAFLANDAGLAHVAAGLGVPVLVVFGMTDPVRALPIGPARAATPSTPCSPCHDEGRRGFDCPLGLEYRCLREDLSVEAVAADMLAIVRGAMPCNVPQEAGPYRLYGRAYGEAASATLSLQPR